MPLVRLGPSMPQIRDLFFGLCPDLLPHYQTVSTVSVMIASERAREERELDTWQFWFPILPEIAKESRRRLGILVGAPAAPTSNPGLSGPFSRDISLEDE